MGLAPIWRYLFDLRSVVKLIKKPAYFERTCPSCFHFYSNSVKYVGVYSYLLGLALVGHDFWEKVLGNLSLSKKQVFGHACARFFAFFMVPLMVYIGVFYIHLSTLVNAGPHDSAMSSAFQASLEVRKDILLIFKNWVCFLFSLLLCKGWIEFHRPWPAPGSRSWFPGDFATRPRLSLLVAQPRSQLSCQIRRQTRIFSSTASDVLCRQRYQQLVDYQETKQV